MDDDSEFEFDHLSSESVSHLNYQQRLLYAELWKDLIEYLQTRGKEPSREIGYDESGVRPRVRRIHQVFEYAWEQDRQVLELTPDLADQFTEGLRTDEITRNDGGEYKQGSKRKFINTLESSFRFVDTDWESEIRFQDDSATFDSDPFNRRERELLLNASFEYQSPPRSVIDGRRIWHSYWGSPKAGCHRLIGRNSNEAGSSRP